jgi:osmoprotectant transport system permease protein
MGGVWDAFREQNGWSQTWIHVKLSLAALGLATIVGLALGILCAKIGRAAAFIVVTVSNLGRTVPTFALIALILALTSLGFWPAVFGLFLLGVPPILLNTYTGVKEVDSGVIEASRGMGFRPWQVLGRVELPMAMPLIFAGIRTSSVQIIATAALAGLVGANGLGVIVSSGLANNQDDVILAGAIPITILAALSEFVFGGAERIATPRGLRISRTRTT